MYCRTLSSALGVRGVERRLQCGKMSCLGSVCVRLVLSLWSVFLQDFPSEVVRFSSLNSSWLKLMKTTSETRNLMSCCLGGDSPKMSLLDKLQQDLEECRKSLSTYLIAKKQVLWLHQYVLYHITTCSDVSITWKVAAVGYRDV